MSYSLKQTIADLDGEIKNHLREANVKHNRREALKEELEALRRSIEILRAKESKARRRQAAEMR